MEVVGISSSMHTTPDPNSYFSKQQKLIGQELTLDGKVGDDGLTAVKGAEVVGEEIVKLINTIVTQLLREYIDAEKMELV